MRIRKSIRKVVSCAVALMLVVSVLVVPTAISASAASTGTAVQSWDFSTLKSSDSSETGENIKTITNADGTILSKNPNSGTIGGFWIDNNAIIASGQDPKALVRLNLKLSDNLVKGKKYKFNLGVYTATGTGWPDASQIRLFYAPSALTYPEACQFNTTDWTDKIPDSAELLCKLSYAKNIPTETDNVIEMSFIAEKDYSDGYLVVWFNGSYGNYHRFAFNSASLDEIPIKIWDFSTLKESDADENGEGVKTITNGDGTILHKNPNSGAIGGYWLSDNKTTITCNFSNKGNVRMNFKLNTTLKSGSVYKFDFGVYRTAGNQWIDGSQMRLFWAPNALTYPEATKSLGAEGNWADIIPDSAELLCNRTDIQISDSTNNKIEFKFTAQKDYSDGYLVVWFNNNAGNQCKVYSAELNDVSPSASFVNGESKVASVTKAKFNAPAAPDMGEFTFIGWTADNRNVYGAGDEITIRENTVFHAVGIKVKTLDEASVRWSGEDAKRGLRFYTEVTFNDEAYSNCVSPAKIGAEIKSKDGEKTVDVSNALDGGNNSWNGSDGNGKYWFYSSLTAFATEYGKQQLDTVYQANGYATVVYANGAEKTIKSGYNVGRSMKAVAQKVLDNTPELTEQQVMLLTEIYGAVKA